MMLVNINSHNNISSCKEIQSDKPGQSLQGPVPDRRESQCCPADWTGPQSAPARPTHDMTLVTLVDLAPHPISTHGTLKGLL